MGHWQQAPPGDTNGGWYWQGDDGVRSWMNDDVKKRYDESGTSPDKTFVPPGYESGGGGNGGGGNGGGGGRTTTVNPKWSADTAWMPPEQRTALRDYMDWVSWKKGQMMNLLKLYRTEFPKQMAAYKQAAFGELYNKTPQMWGQMNVNLQQRGLEDSASFLGGARQDLEAWKLNERQSINDTADQMRKQYQQTMLGAIGSPNYANLYQNWTQLSQNLNDFNNNWMQRHESGPYRT